MIDFADCKEGEPGYLTDSWLRLSAEFLEYLTGEKKWMEIAEEIIQERKAADGDKKLD